jgi:hypothetical protein
MVDTASLLVAIFAIVVAIVAIVIIYLQIGPAGTAGNEGPTGPQGITGDQGPNGGQTGITGPTGPPSSLGPPGITGPAGIKGPTGLPGLTGAPGGRGNVGYVGPTGAPYGVLNGPYVPVDEPAKGVATFLDNQMVIPIRTGTGGSINNFPLLLNLPSGGASSNGNQMMILNTQSGVNVSYCVPCSDGSDNCANEKCPDGTTPLFYTSNGQGPALGNIPVGASVMLSLVQEADQLRIFEAKWNPP